MRFEIAEELQLTTGDNRADYNHYSGNQRLYDVDYNAELSNRRGVDKPAVSQPKGGNAGRSDPTTNGGSSPRRGYGRNRFGDMSKASS